MLFLENWAETWPEQSCCWAVPCWQERGFNSSVTAPAVWAAWVCLIEGVLSVLSLALVWLCLAHSEQGLAQTPVRNCCAVFAVQTLSLWVEGKKKKSGDWNIPAVWMGLNVCVWSICSVGRRATFYIRQTPVYFSLYVWPICRKLLVGWKFRLGELSPG